MKMILIAAIAAALCVTASAQTTSPAPKFTVNPVLMARIKQERHDKLIAEIKASTEPQPSSPETRATLAKIDAGFRQSVHEQAAIPDAANAQDKPTATPNPLRKLSPRAMEEKNKADYEAQQKIWLQYAKKPTAAPNPAITITSEQAKQNHLHQERMRQWVAAEKARKEAEAKRLAEWNAEMDAGMERIRLAQENRAKNPWKYRYTYNDEDLGLNLELRYMQQQNEEIQMRQFKMEIQQQRLESEQQQAELQRFMGWR